MARKPIVVRSFLHADEFDQRYETVERVLHEMGRIPEPEDVTARLRVLGSELVGIESPCKKIAESAADDSTRQLADQVVAHIECLRDQVASILVDLTESKQLNNIVRGA